MRGPLAHRVFALAGVFLLLLPACDPRAVPAEGSSAESSAGLSSAGETCRATRDCEAPLRCIEAECRDPDVPRLGAYQWAAGRLALAKGNVTEATLAFQQAVGQYEAARKPAPAGLLCDYGTALRRKKGDPTSNEQAARILHRCILEARPGSTEFRRGMTELAELEMLGLDPALLARDETADRYLTRPAKKPSADSIDVQVARTDPTRSRGYDEWIEELQGDTARLKMAPCFGDYFLATQKNRLEVKLPMRFRARYDDFEDMYLGGTLELEDAGGGSGPDAEAARCVREALLSLAKEFGDKQRTSSWKGAVTLTLVAKP